MDIAVLINYAWDFHDTVVEARAMVSAGVDTIAVPEPYSFDGATQLGYLAAAVPEAKLTSSILPLYSRTPTLTAMTAASLDYLTGGRFRLGLGTSGPQVIEGFHGVAYDAPIGRTREYVDICRMVWTGQKVRYEGEYYRLPVAEEKGTGLGRPLAMIRKPLRADIPIDLAALGPKNVELTAEIADGWQPMFVDPQRFRDVWGAALVRGTARRDKTLGPLLIHAQTPTCVGGPGSPGFRAIAEHYALYIGGMGAPGKNFYYNLVSTYGFGAEAAQIQEAFLSGRKDRAADLVPDALIEATCLTGGIDEKRRHLESLREAGVDSVFLIPFDQDPGTRLAAVREVAAARSQGIAQ
ncbi:LLM class F420-dependent oxidoreductase [Gordonia sp. TBRC 11910]|uniref:LLM class F420-dependent oxidoreductase n=1 Tax=Gordonia asplenii TaxID=2725283 RepID=A0A848L7R5_9ACTN|nr:LLM class F420-dependent oxidoreductase [Gordonia asplenii]NMO03618.1 LLM class F420-dependent oxidoreductase [Gordonia asplenii]